MSVTLTIGNPATIAPAPPPISACLPPARRRLRHASLLPPLAKGAERNRHSPLRADRFRGTGGDIAPCADTFRGTGGAVAPCADTFRGTGGAVAPGADTFRGTGGAVAPCADRFRGTGEDIAPCVDTFRRHWRGRCPVRGHFQSHWKGRLQSARTLSVSLEGPFQSAGTRSVALEVTSAPCTDHFCGTGSTRAPCAEHFCGTGSARAPCAEHFSGTGSRGASCAARFRGTALPMPARIERRTVRWAQDAHPLIAVGRPSSLALDSSEPGRSISLRTDRALPRLIAPHGDRTARANRWPTSRATASVEVRRRASRNCARVAPRSRSPSARQASAAAYCV